MSIYVTVTENYYGEPQVFLTKEAAEKYMEEFIKSTNGRIDIIVREFKPFPLVYALNEDGSVSHGPLYHFGTDPASGRVILGNAFDNMDPWRANQIRPAAPGSVVEEE